MPWANQLTGLPELDAPNAPLISVEDFAAYHGISPAPDSGSEAYSAIQDKIQVASGMIRDACEGRVFTPMEDEEVTVDGTGARTLLLPHTRLPVRAISEITNEDGDVVDAALYDWSADGRVRLLEPGARWTDRLGAITVTYSHGFVPVLPQGIIGVALSLSKRLYDNPDAQQPAAETIGGYSVTFGGQGALGVTELEAMTLGRYRVRR